MPTRRAVTFREASRLPIPSCPQLKTTSRPTPLDPCTPAFLPLFRFGHSFCTFRYSYSPDDVASIGHCAATVLPADSEFGPQFHILKSHIEDCSALLSLRGVENATSFAQAVAFCEGIDIDESKQKEANEKFFVTLADRLKECREDNQYYNIARSADAFSRVLPNDQELFCVLSKHLHRHLNMLEPHEFLRTARGFSQQLLRMRV